MATTDVSIDKARNVAERILTAVGTPTDAAGQVATSLVGANQVGHDSHGIIRLLEYVTFVDRGQVKPNASPFVASGKAAVRVVDGAHGWGQVASHFAIEILGDLADEFGLGSVSVRNCNHIGRIGEYAEALAERGLGSLIWCDSDPTVAPFGGRDRVLGSNPFAVGVPVAGSSPIVLDFATAAAAEGKLRVARATGKDVEPGILIDREGHASTDPNDFYAGGALLPFGAHKGYAMSVFIEILGGALSGNHPSPTPRYRSGNGVVLIAFRPDAFVPAEDFVADVADSVSALRSSRPIEPGAPVLVPGDVEANVRAQRQASIPVAEEIWADVLELLRARESAVSS